MILLFFIEIYIIIILSKLFYSLTIYSHAQQFTGNVLSLSQSNPYKANAKLYPPNKKHKTVPFIVIINIIDTMCKIE
jgi:hypothetical protein